jgi:hypothetical protein
VESRVSEPGRTAGFARVEAGGDAEELGEERVAITAAAPLAADGDGVADECAAMSAPHQDGGMGAPGAGVSAEHAEDLVALDALLSQAAVIEGPSGGAEVGEREIGLQADIRCGRRGRVAEFFTTETRRFGENQEEETRRKTV